MSDVPASEICSTDKSTRWKEKTLKMSLLLLFVINSFLLVVIVAFIWSRRNNVCITEQCVITANRVITAMDRSIDPCADFYRFACGNWIKNNPVPYWTSSWDRMAALKESLAQDMLQLLDSEEQLGQKGLSGPTAVKKAKTFYRTCIGETEISEAAVQRLRTSLATLGLPTHPLNTTTLDWLYVIANIRRSLGFHLLFALTVNVHVRNSSVHQMTLAQASVGFPEKLLQDPMKYKDSIDYYKSFITENLEAYSKETVGKEFAEDVLDLSIRLAKAMAPADIRTGTGHKLYECNLQQLARGPNINSSTWDTINWTRYFEIVFEKVNITLDVARDRVLVYDVPYLKRLSEILKNVKETALVRYLWWTTFTKFPPVTAKLEELSAVFSEKIHKVRISKRRLCAHNLISNFGFAMSHLYIKKRFKNKHKVRALEMLGNTKEAFIENVRNQNWTDDVTRDRALEKLDAMRSFVGYPRWVMDSRQLDNHYKNVHVVEGEKLTTFLSIRASSTKFHLEKIRKSVNRNRWMPPTTVNAFYSYDQNLVNVPVGILQPPFFDNGIEAMDYGAIGSIMGHEITHGFDDRGRRFDKNGNLNDWWTEGTLKKYKDRVDCVIKQYDEYWAPELGRAFKVDGTKTKEENVADNGGMKAAFGAYKQRRGESGSALPGLQNLEDDQLFFLAYAQNWCATYTLEGLKNRLAEGKYSPNRIRVLGTLANSPEFASSWRCPAGSAMNPINKCVLW